MTPGQMIDGYAKVGLELYLDCHGQLVLRGPMALRDAARPAVSARRDRLVRELRRRRGQAIARLLAFDASHVRGDGVAAT